MRPAAAPFGPQAVDHEAEPAALAGTLPAVGGPSFAPPAVFGRPAQCESVSGNRQLPHRPAALNGGHIDRPARDAALIRLRGSGGRSEKRDGGREGGRPPAGQSNVAGSAVGSLCVSQATASSRTRNTAAEISSAYIARPSSVVTVRAKDAASV